jgi:hypothetical protein
VIQIDKNSYPRKLSNPDHHHAENTQPSKKFRVIVETKDSSEILVSLSDMYGIETSLEMKK